MSSDRTEPKGSASSSPDDKCATCGHWRRSHDSGTCFPCPHDKSRHVYVPAEPEAHEHDWTDWGAVYHGGHIQWRECRGCKHTEARTEGHSCPECDPEPEASKPWLCGDCGAEVLAGQDWCRNCGDVKSEPVPPMPRPPFLVAYATGSGALNELALPGEASVAVVDGSLVISHASGVLGIASVKPLEMQ